MQATVWDPAAAPRPRLPLATLYVPSLNCLVFSEKSPAGRCGYGTAGSSRAATGASGTVKAAITEMPASAYGVAIERAAGAAAVFR